MCTPHEFDTSRPTRPLAVMFVQRSIATRSCTRRCSSAVNAFCFRPFSRSTSTTSGSLLTRTQTIRSEREMETLGERLARGRQPGDVLFLQGLVTDLTAALMISMVSCATACRGGAHMAVRNSVDVMFQRSGLWENVSRSRICTSAHTANAVGGAVADVFAGQYVR